MYGLPGGSYDAALRAVSVFDRGGKESPDFKTVSVELWATLSLQDFI